MWRHLHQFFVNAMRATERPRPMQHTFSLTCDIFIGPSTTNYVLSTRCRPWKGTWSRQCWLTVPQNQTNARNALFQMAEDDIPVEDRVFGEGFYLRPQFIQPYRSKNVLIEGITILNSPMWIVHPVLCENVIVRNINITR